MGIELTRAQKIQVGVAALILGAAGYVLYEGMKPAPDMTIASWVERRFEGKTPEKPISQANPMDPSKTATVTIFACYDGRLEIAEYPPASGQCATFSFEPDERRNSFAVYQDPLKTIEAIRDPYKRVLMFAAYSAANDQPRGLFGRLNLDAQQRKEEKDARQQMMDAIVVMNEGAQIGNFHKEAYEAALAALNAYRAKPGDSTKDPAKAELAHKVVEASIHYLTLMNDKKWEAITRYVASVDKILKEDQKTKLAEVKVNMRTVRRPRLIASAVGG